MVIAVVNLKGGVGKSTIAVNLACELSTRQKVVTLIDADDQGTSTAWAAAGHLPVKCHAMPLESAREVQGWIRRVSSLPAGVTVIDCPPRIAAATEAAIGLADLTIVPIGASGADLAATASALALIGRARAARKDGGPRCLLVPSRVDRRTASGREIEGVLASLGEPIGPTISQRAALVDAFSAGQWIGEYAPESQAHQDMRDLAAHVIK